MKKEVLIILSMWTLSTNLFSQIWTEPKPLLPGASIDSPRGGCWFATDDSGGFWCAFHIWRGTPTLAHLAYYNPVDDSWIYATEIFEKNLSLSSFFRDKKGNLWAVGHQLDGDIYAKYYRNSSWSAEMKVPTLPACKFNSTACADSNGNVWVAWTTTYWGWEVCCSWYDGETWHPPVRLTHASGDDDNCVSSITTDKFGRVWVAWFTYPHRGVYVKYYDGEEWSDSLPVDTVDSHLKLACDSKGRVWGVWNSWTGKFGDTANICVSYYEEGKWSIPVILSKEPTKKDFYLWPDIIVDKRDRVWVIWNSMKSDTNGDIWFSYYDGRKWSEAAPVDNHPAKDRGGSLGVDGKGRVWCGFTTYRDGPYANIYVCHTTEESIKEENKNNTIKLELLNFPNPFKGVTSIEYQVVSKGPISLEVYDASGRLIRNLAKVQSTEHRAYTTIWDGRDENGELLPAGVYFIELKTENYLLTRKVILMR